MSAPFTPSPHVVTNAQARQTAEKMPRHTSGALKRKRLFDLALLLPTLPIFVPATLGLAAVSWSVEGGPVFFRQTRATVGGAPFTIYKLRTMTLDDDVEKRRPTRFGQWMRLRGLDELPQLFNVFKGDMSLVGPRPLLHADIDRLSSTAPEFADRLHVPPGLTGLAQTTMTTGAVATAKLDAHYARTHSALGDLKVLVRTAWMNIVGKQRGKATAPTIAVARGATTAT